MAVQPLGAREAFKINLWRENPIFRQVLGICSTLAVTNLLVNTSVMVAGLIYAAAMSSVTMSMIRNVTPRRIRIMVEVLVISFYVIILHLFLRAYLPDISYQLGPYVGLIITNCILQGRLEAFAISNKPVPSFFDGLGCGLGYGAILMPIAFVRELTGFRALFGMRVLGDWWTPWTLMIMPAGAFFALGVLVWGCRRIASPPVETTKGGAA
jgi:Na+-transporting NADH:ubiquinone oxidoreductase subunit D